MEIHAEDVNVALAEGMRKLETFGTRSTSRNGEVLVIDEPVMTTYYNPNFRVLFGRLRDANPFFHLFEALWMLKGRNDVQSLTRFAKQIAEYSDDGRTLWGAYGWRWRDFFGYDQLNAIAAEFKKNPDSRRAVLQMWNAMRVDAQYGEYGDTIVEDAIEPDCHVAFNGGKDVPCNTAAYFDTRGGKLNMTVTCRSNDALWGAYGANAVHFSILLEYMAAKIGLPMGVYRQFSNNLHAYTATCPDRIAIAQDAELHDHYQEGFVDENGIGELLLPLVGPGESIKMFDEDLNDWFGHAGRLNEYAHWNTRFFRDVVVPMYGAHDAWKVDKNGELAMRRAAMIKAPDWRIAAMEWLGRRIYKATLKAAQS